MHRFLQLHNRWVDAPGLGTGKMDRWMQQKLRADVKRGLAKRSRAPCALGQGQ